MSEDIEQYRERYTLRPETFEAYVDVWHRVPQARQQFRGWAAFSQAANAEPSWRAKRPEKVETAAAIMESAGYEIGPPTRRGARRWYPTGVAPGTAVDRPNATPAPGVAVGEAEKTPPSSRPSVRHPDAPYTDELLSSPLWQERAEGSRARLDEERVRATLAAMHAGGGVATYDGIAAAGGPPVDRLPGFLATLERILNSQGQIVVAVDRDSREVRLDRAALVEAFLG